MLRPSSTSSTSLPAARHRASVLAGLAMFIALIVPVGVPGLPGSSLSHAQDDLGVGSELFPEFSLGGFGSAASEPATWSADFVRTDSGAGSGETTEADEATKGRINVTVKLKPGWHVYSLTQKAGGPLPTRLEIQSPAGVKLLQDWSASEPPKKSVSDLYGGLTVEEHDGTVVFSAPVSLPADFSGPIKVRVDALSCKTDGACIPIDETLTAKVADGGTAAVSSPSTATATETLAFAQDVEALSAGADDASEAPAGEPFRDDDYVVEWTASVDPSAASLGGQPALQFTARPDSSFHVYKAATKKATSATLFVITEKSGLQLGAPQPSDPAVQMQLFPTMPAVSYHKGNVTWSLPIAVPDSFASRAVDAEPIQVEGYIAYQACTDTSCRQPMALKFVAPLKVDAATESVSLAAPVKLTPAKYNVVANLAAKTRWVDDLKTADGAGAADDISATGATSESDATPALSADPEGVLAEAAEETIEASEDDSDAELAAAPMSFPLVLFFSFVGGVILNVMPCVLPVVGLKVMSFVQQAGQDRRRVLMLNLVYTAGILAVFAVLAVLAVALSFSWGEQFTYFYVRLGLTLLLFALALSYLGVWEIPVPGMASGQASQELQSREGYTGAFFKGVFATILATPCSGPLLGGILGLTFGLSSIETMTVIMTVGVGMALPYVIIGMRPGLVSWLPKPGAWMETLKQFLAFMFLGTVAFFFSQFEDEQRVPLFITLIGVWFGCWLIGLVPNWQAIQRRLLAWTGGIAAATLIGVLAFSNTDSPEVVQWEPYSEARLEELTAEGRTVMVDFTAKWCVNCIVNYNVAINTEPTRDLMDKLDAVALYADWTDRDPEIKAKLEELQSRSIPVLAVYPGAKPESPIILRDLISQQDVLDALRDAGASLDEGESIARKPESRDVATLTK